MARDIFFVCGLNARRDGHPGLLQRYNGTGNTNDQAYAVAVDSSNNVIVTGNSCGSGGNLDYATIKYSSAGVPLWTNRYNGPGTATTARRRGGGQQQQRDRDGVSDEQCPGTITRQSSIRATVCRFGPTTTTGRRTAATKPAPGGGHSDNVIVTGYSVWLQTYANYLTIKYSATGVPVWTNRYIGPALGALCTRCRGGPQ